MARPIGLVEFECGEVGKDGTTSNCLERLEFHMAIVKIKNGEVLQDAFLWIGECPDEVGFEVIAFTN